MAAICERRGGELGVDAFDSDGLDGRRLEQVLRCVRRAAFVAELELSLGLSQASEHDHATQQHQNEPQ